jgi:cellobiose phosphorylase
MGELTTNNESKKKSFVRQEQDNSVLSILGKIRENLQQGRNLNDSIDPGDWKRTLEMYSVFNDKFENGWLIDSEVQIKTPHTPRPCLHLMASNHTDEYNCWGSFWDQLGGGFSCVDSVTAGKMSSHLDNNYVPTAPRQQDVRSFYVHEDGKAWPMFVVPHYEEKLYTNYKCTQNSDMVLIQAQRESLLCTLEATVHPTLPAELWNITVKNVSDCRRTFRWFSKLNINLDQHPFYYCDIRVVCEGRLEDNSMVFLNHDKNNCHQRHSFFTAYPDFDGFDMMGETFDGIGGRSPIPAAVARGKCFDSLGHQPYAGLIAGAQFNAELNPGESKSWTCLFGRCSYDSDERQQYIEKIKSDVACSWFKVQRDVRDIWRKKTQALMVKTPDNDIDRYFNVHAKYQARNQARFVRALDKVGYRDIIQDLLGVCDAEPEYVRTILGRALHYQLPDGRAIRQYEKFANSGHDLRMYMDSPSWIPDLLVRYLNESGDYAFLDEEIPFFDMDTLQPDPQNTASVYQHCLMAVRSLYNNQGYHGLCKIGYGDWNDALSRIGGEKGVSVWLSCACVYAAEKMEKLAGFIGEYKDAEEMKDIANTIADRINEYAWDGDWYIYAISGDGKPIGSKRNTQGQIHLNVNTWAIFTGVAKRANREKQVLDSIATLQTPVGYQLLKPPYTTDSRDEVGRISDEIPGMFENGSIYIHGQAFFLYAMIASGRSDICYSELRKTLPSCNIQELTSTPRNQQSNFTVGPDHPSFGLQPFSNFTGSLGWYIKVIECMMGVYPEFDSLVIAPQVPSDWDSYSVRKIWRGREILVDLKRVSSNPKITLNDSEYDKMIPITDLSEKQINHIKVEFI